MNVPDYPLEGGCACGQIRYQLLQAPLFVHLCHCSRCQVETGSSFVHNAMIESDQLQLLAGETLAVKLPTDSKSAHWVSRCPSCLVTLWSDYGRKSALMKYLRVGTLDAPSEHPPLAEIYVRSRATWLQPQAGLPQYRSHYDARKLWPAASLLRYDEAKARHA
jgi:hypothetical protein